MQLLFSISKYVTVILDIQKFSHANFMFPRLTQVNMQGWIHKMAFSYQNLPLFRMVNYFYKYKEFYAIFL